MSMEWGNEYVGRGDWRRSGKGGVGYVISQ